LDSLDSEWVFLHYMYQSEINNPADLYCTISTSPIARRARHRLLATYTHHILAYRSANLPHLPPSTGSKLTSMHEIQPPIPIPRPTVVPQPGALRPTLVQDILKRVPANLLRIAARPRQVSAVRRPVRAVVLPLVRVAAHVLARGVQRVARRGAHGAEAVAGAFGGEDGGGGQEGEEEGGGGEVHCGGWGVGTGW
jgi:hypothetical protein